MSVLEFRSVCVGLGWIGMGWPDGVSGNEKKMVCLLESGCYD